MWVKGRRNEHWVSQMTQKSSEVTGSPGRSTRLRGRFRFFQESTCTLAWSLWLFKKSTNPWWDKATQTVGTRYPMFSRRETSADFDGLKCHPAQRPASLPTALPSPGRQEHNRPHSPSHPLPHTTSKATASSQQTCLGCGVFLLGLFFHEEGGKYVRAEQRLGCREGVEGEANDRM